MLRVALSSALACLLASSAHAAGGHHAIDDATILDAGQCQIETWFEHVVAGSGRLWHFGPACRVGPVELGLNIDAVRSDGDIRNNLAGVQAKWARPLTDKVSLGASIAPAWQDHSPHPVGTSVALLLTWQASETLLLHVNAGRDFLHAVGDAGRGGVAAEWSPSQEWSFVAERWRELHNDRWRLGARRSLNANVSVDLSRAQGLGHASSTWTVGVNWVFDR